MPHRFYKALAKGAVYNEKGNEYKAINGKNLSYYWNNNEKAKKVIIPDKVKIDGISGKVTAIEANAF